MVTVELPFDQRGLAVRGVAVILVASVLFGTMAVCVRVATADLPAMQVAFVRFGGSLLVLLACTRGRALRPHAAATGRLLLRGLLGAVSIMLYYFGIQQAGAGLATLLDCTYPLFTALWAGLLMGEAFSSRLGIALVLNLVGVSVVLGDGGQAGPHVTLGALSSLAAAVFAGAAVATARTLRTTENASLITTYFMAVGTAVTAPALLHGLPSVSLGAGLALALVVLTSVAGPWLLHHGLGFTSATQGSLAAATSVLTAALLEAALLGTHLSGGMVIGAFLMIGAVGLGVGRA
jgi:drug/metabolite transporter (DMT)-like permease